MKENMARIKQDSRWRTIWAMLIIMVIIAFCLSPQFRSIYGLPLHMRIIEGETALLDVNFPMTVSVKHSDPSIRIQSFPAVLPILALSRPISFEPVKLGQSTIEFKLLGIIPLRTVLVDVLPPVKLIPGGHSIGVVLRSQGVIVVGNSPILTMYGQYVTPGKDAGIEVGDVIISINGTPVQSDTQVAELIDDCGKKNQKADIFIKRNGGQYHVTILPALCSDTKRYRIGLFVRDSAAGVGTLTFYEPNSKIFGALGHVITDSDTNQPIDCEEGKIVLATVSGIQHGKRGQPGEKIGVFIEEDQLLGNIRKNTNFGIYGDLHTQLQNDKYPDALPVASMSQIQLGPAEMLTVVDGQTIEEFSIEIQKINMQDAPESKGLVIKVTDPKLIEKTGGIVQGMSGSPIIQNGKIVGAVTHVFVHDPTSGYGCFIDWMLMESGILPKKEQQTAKKLFTIKEKYYRLGTKAKSFCFF
ncbi:MAG TPA: SpoIVB peptidase [Methylomusa anaerophila]|uniref:SpoIVB peptidase n=1 Tax=Methylomusa anaerophila TaxID=1930071 RepID=A0A348APD2_9FIRM|nr:SpoIVB peptidase [Methylomusa anaerophila]BBB92930.1 SpoIVB peptidase precursor [Methylomusa anaerophila]HML87235.1 SpoIVB peptidase [Methylomusa anaerophila]